MATPNQRVFEKCITLNCLDDSGLQSYAAEAHLLYKNALASLLLCRFFFLQISNYMLCFLKLVACAMF